jgi:hypothetical protein
MKLELGNLHGSQLEQSLWDKLNKISTGGCSSKQNITQKKDLEVVSSFLVLFLDKDLENSPMCYKRMLI